MDLHPGTAAFDHAAAADLAPRLTVCLRSAEWVQAVLAGRPHGGPAELERAALDAARDLSPEGVAEALAAHPRLGERPAGTSPEAAHSRREQSDLARDASTASRLHAANLAYEARFGHVLLVRAAGRSAEEVLALAERRLGHDPATEGVVVRQQLGEIAVLRLRDLLAGLDRLGAPAGVRP